MSPTPRDAQRASDNNPQRILDQAVKTIIGQMPPKLVPPRDSDEYPLLEQEVTEQVLSRHLAVQLSNQVPDDIMVTGGTSLMLRAPNQPPSSVFYAAFLVICGFFSHLRGLLEGFLVVWWPRLSQKGCPRQWEAAPVPFTPCALSASPHARLGTTTHHSGLIRPTRFPNQHMAAWVSSHTGAKRLKVKN